MQRYQAGVLTFDEANVLLKDVKKARTEVMDALDEIESDTPESQLIEIMEIFLQENPMYFDTKTKIWWIWNAEAFKWEIGIEQDILRIFLDRYAFCKWLKPNIKMQLLHSLEVVAKRPPKPLQPQWLQFRNRVINVLNGEERVPTSEYWYLNPLPWDIGESEDTPTIDRYFCDWVGSDYATLMFQVIAYSLYRGYPIHRIFFFVGSGRNGKTTFMKLLTKFITEENRTSTDLERLKDSRFEAAKLYNKLVCEIAETSINILYDTARLKAYTGESYLPGEIKNKNPFEFLSYAKLFVLTNNLPVTSDTSDGFFRRCLVVEFPNHFEEGYDLIAQIPDAEFCNLGRKCCRILKELLETMKFDKEGSIEDRKNKYEEKSNPIKAFLIECYELDIYSHVKTSEFYDNYKNWAKIKKIYKKLLPRDVKRILTFMGFDVLRTRANIGENPIWVINGLSKKETVQGVQGVL